MYYAELEVQGGHIYPKRGSFVYAFMTATVKPGEKLVQFMYFEIPLGAVPMTFTLYRGLPPEMEVVCTIKLGE